MHWGPFPVQMKDFRPVTLAVELFTGLATLTAPSATNPPQPPPAPNYTAGTYPDLSGVPPIVFQPGGFQPGSCQLGTGQVSDPFNLSVASFQRTGLSGELLATLGSSDQKQSK